MHNPGVRSGADLQGAVDAVAAGLGASIGEACRERLVAFLHMACVWNERHNLFGPLDGASAAEIVLADAIVLAQSEFVPAGARFIDVGSGGGAPSIPLLLMREDVSGVLVEPRKKRVAFLRAALGTLRLESRARVYATRVTLDDPPAALGPFDIAMSRATFAPSAWLALGHVLAPRTVVFATGDPWSGTPPAHSVQYRLPVSGASRALLAFNRPSDGA